VVAETTKEDDGLTSNISFDMTGRIVAALQDMWYTTLFTVTSLPRQGLKTRRVSA